MKNTWRVGLLMALLHVWSNMMSAQKPSSSPQEPGATYEPVIPPASDKYPLGPDSLRRLSVPQGVTFQFQLTNSVIFPATTRTITVYVPAQYQADKPACLYVGLDGLFLNIPIVFDNLIAQHAMPVTIAVGVSPGVVAAEASSENPRFDRSMEFDTRSGRLASFLLDEVLPEVQKHRTPGGQPILLSANPDDRAIGGASTGGIGSFTVAWERPDSFHRVFTAIGTFVGMRGGEQDYVFVRKTEPKPLRIFMQDGVHDEWSGAEMGDWWMANQTMERALSFAGYDVAHVWGTGTHFDGHAAAIFPDAMRWLWKGWPAPVHGHPSESPVLKEVLQRDQQWERAIQGCDSGMSIAASPAGRVFYTNYDTEPINELGFGTASINCKKVREEPLPFAIGPDGAQYRALPKGGIQVLNTTVRQERARILAGNLHIVNFVVRSNGDVYAAVHGTGGSDELWRISAVGEASQCKASIKGAAGLAFSPDGLWLFVAQKQSHLGLSFRVRESGQLDAGEPFYDFAVQATLDSSGAGSVAMDESGRAYVATPMGVQIFDRNGRVVAILPLPGNEMATGICFGGSELDTLYVAAGNKIYRRKLRIVGASPWAKPRKLPPWRAG